MSFSRRSAVLGLLVAMGCHTDGTGPVRHLATGTYVLRTVSGRGAVSGSLLLSANGEAERHARYGQTSVSTQEYVARGTYQVRADNTVDLQLREDDGRSPYVWMPHARLLDGAVELRYPDPADGPEIMERYERLVPVSTAH